MSKRRTYLSSKIDLQQIYVFIVYYSGIIMIIDSDIYRGTKVQSLGMKHDLCFLKHPSHLVSYE